MLNVTFRVDTAPNIGAGHIMRCFALGYAIRKIGGRVNLISSFQSPLHEAWKDELGAKIYADENITVGSHDDLIRTIQMVRQTGSNWLVVDSYSIDSEWINAAASKTRTMLIDDIGDRNVAVALIVNHNPGAEIRYANSYLNCSQALLGLPWFMRGPQWERHHKPTEKKSLLITLGTGNDSALIPKIIKALLGDGRDFDADLVSMTIADSAISTLPHSTKQIHHHLGPLNLPPLMSRAKVVICGGGVTPLEAISIGVVPVLIVLADNQKPGASSLAAKGAAAVFDLADLSWPQVAARALDLLHNEDEWSKFRSAGDRLIDGQGAERVASIMALTE